MTKQTQQQRREKKKLSKQTHDNSDNHESHVSEHEEFVSSNIKYVYPNANVINMTSVIHSSKNVLSNVENLNEFTKDDNNIIIVFNINTPNFTKFYYCYMEWKNVPTSLFPKVKDNIAFLIVRGSNVILYPTPELGNSDVITNTIKYNLKPRVEECLICFHEFVFGEKRVSCCNCHMPMCKECFTHYIKESPGWCPYCTKHLMYYGLGKSCFQDDALYNLFNVFVGEQMRTSIKQTNGVATIPAQHLADKWLSFLQQRVYVT